MNKIYYNEIEPFACFWLENLMKDGFIAEGQIDNRSIRDIQPEDLEGYTQCHFFAGIGVWSYALRQAGWSDDRPIWTGSCPCQPFSQAGLHKGEKDDRHLWPEFHRLIKECRPSTIAGEMVSGRGGRQFIDLLQSDLEKENYSATAVGLGAHSVGTTHSQGFHKRQRLYWVAEELGNSAEIGRRGWSKERGDHKWTGGEGQQDLRNTTRDQSSGRVETDSGIVDNPNDQRVRSGRELLEGGQASDRKRQAMSIGSSVNVSLANTNSERQEIKQANDNRQTKMDEPKRSSAHSTHDARHSESISVANTNSQRSQGFGAKSEQQQHTKGRQNEIGHGSTDSQHSGSDHQNDTGWNYDLIWCRDEKWRPVECGTFPMADAVTNRIHILKALGNAIPGDTAKIFIESYMDSVVDRYGD